MYVSTVYSLLFPDICEKKITRILLSWDYQREYFAYRVFSNFFFHRTLGESTEYTVLTHRCEGQTKINNYLNNDSCCLGIISGLMNREVIRVNILIANYWRF